MMWVVMPQNGLTISTTLLPAEENYPAIRQDQRVEDFMLFAGQVGVMVQLRNYGYHSGTIRMRKETISDSGLPVMFRFPTKLNSLCFATIFASALVYGVVATAQDNREQSSPSSSSSDHSTQLSPPPNKIYKPGQTVFRPRETIAPGKPVSFPSDI